MGGEGLLKVFVALALVVLVAFPPGCKGAATPKAPSIPRPRSLVTPLEATDAQAGKVDNEAPASLKPETAKLKGMCARNVVDAKAQDAEIDVAVMQGTEATKKLSEATKENVALKKAAKKSNWWGRLKAGVLAIFALLGCVGVPIYAFFAMKAQSVARKWILRVFPVIVAALVAGMIVTTYFWPLFIGLLVLAAIGVVLAIAGIIKVPEFTITKNHT